ncbi:MAG: hypothetical protein ACR2FF_10960 [Mycobacteriales bacterium]
MSPMHTPTTIDVVPSDVGPLGARLRYTASTLRALASAADATLQRAAQGDPILGAACGAAALALRLRIAHVSEHAHRLGAAYASAAAEYAQADRSIVVSAEQADPAGR